ncbi:MAG: glycosyltransferase, partial [Anaerolineae bacterium]|nr:glycosyltransferase [Anaerolineae bacterium]
MHVLMISLDSSMLGDQHGNTIQRHIEYAKRIGDLTVVAYNPATQPKAVTRINDQFEIHPVNTTPVLFPWRAYRIAARVHHARPVDVVTTQGPFSTGLVGVLLKKRLGIPLNMQSHSHFFENPHWIAERPLRNRLLYTLAKVLLPYADTHRVLTERVKAQYVKRGVSADRIAVLSVPTHVDIFAEPVSAERLTALRESLDIAPDAPVMVWVGFPFAFKNVD